MYLKAIGQGFHAKPSPTLGSLPAGLKVDIRSTVRPVDFSLGVVDVHVRHLEKKAYVLQWIPFVLRKTLFDFIKSCGSQIRLKFSEVALLGLLYSPK